MIGRKHLASPVTLVKDMEKDFPYRFQVKLKNGKDLSPTGVKPTIQVGNWDQERIK